MNLKSLRHLVTILLLLGNLALSEKIVRADPPMYDTSQKFQAAITTGLITGLDPAATDPASQASYNSLSTVYHTVPSTYIGNTNVSTTTGVDGMRSATTGGVGGSVVGAYLIKVYPDPDYSYVPFDIMFTLESVSHTDTSDGLNAFSVTAFDEQNRIKYWTWDSTRLTTGTNRFHIDFLNGQGSNNTTDFGVDPLFDLTHVTGLQISYKGRYSDGNGLTFTTNSLIVPEPGDTVTLTLGILLGTASFLFRYKLFRYKLF